MEVVLLVVHLMLAMGLVAIILLQKSEGGALSGMGGGGGGMSGFLTGRAAGNILTRVTAILAALFMCTSLALAILSSHGSKAPSSVTDRPSPTAPANNVMPAMPGTPTQTAPTQTTPNPTTTNPATPAPTEPAKPAVPTR